MPKTTKKHQYPLFFYIFSLYKCSFHPIFFGAHPTMLQSCSSVVAELFEKSAILPNNSATTLQQRSKKVPFSSRKTCQYVSKQVNMSQYVSKRVNMSQYVSKQVKTGQNESIWVNMGQYGSKRVNMCHGVVFQ